MASDFRVFFQPSWNGKGIGIRIIAYPFGSHVRQKSFTGKEILRVLFSSKIKPIGV